MIKALYLPVVVIVSFLAYTIYSQDLKTREVREYGKLKALVYSKTKCRFCTAAKEILHKDNIAYDEIDITWDKELHQKLYKKTNQSSVPYIFINGNFIGGYDELAKLKKENKLNKLAP